LGRLEVEWGKVAFWSTKEAISLKRVKLLWTWRAYRNSPTLFQIVPSHTTYGLPSPRSGVHNPDPNLASSLHAQGPSEEKPIKILEKRQRERIQGLSKFLEYPLISQEWDKLQT